MPAALGIFRQILRSASPFLRRNPFQDENVYFPQRMAKRFFSIQKPPNVEAITMTSVRERLIKSLGMEEEYNPMPKPRDHLTKYEPKLEDLPPRSMADSFSTAIIPLSKERSLKDKYVTFLGHVRLGRLMEDMDLFAVWVAHKHLHIPNLDPNIPLPFNFVTALVDNVSYTNYTPHPNQDIRLYGHTSWVGRSSMEVIVWLEQELHGKWEKITRAHFVMVARNATNTKSAFVNPLKPANPEEEKLYAAAVERTKGRKQQVSQSLTKVEPNDHEQKIIHEMFRQSIREDHFSLNKRVLPRNSRWMEDGRMSNLIFSHPENRNAHNKVFGGFIMRNAYEVSWACAYIFCRHRPKLLHINDIIFQKPVEVSNFIKMTAHVVYTEMNYIQLITVADIFDPATGETFNSNIFYYTLAALETVPKIVPKTYQEAMWYLDGRRKLLAALGLSSTDIKLS